MSQEVEFHVKLINLTLTDRNQVVSSIDDSVVLIAEKVAQEGKKKFRKII